MRLILACTIVFGALGLFLYFLRIRGGTVMKRLGIRKNSTMSVQEVLPVGNRQQFVLLKRGQRRYLIFSTPHGSILLDSFGAANSNADDRGEEK